MGERRMFCLAVEQGQQSELPAAELPALPPAATTEIVAQQVSGVFWLRKDRPGCLGSVRADNNVFNNVPGGPAEEC
jgi:hypothetical protein